MKLDKILSTLKGNNDFFEGPLCGAVWPSIAKALEKTETTEPAEKIFWLWADLGSPEPPGGPTVDVHIPINVENRIEGLTDAESYRFNSLMVTLIEASGLRYLGSNLWVEDWQRGSDSWEHFRESAYEIAANYISNDLWDRFCS